MFLFLRLAVSACLTLAVAAHGAGSLRDIESVASTTTIDSKTLRDFSATCPIDKRMLSAVVTAGDTQRTFVVAQELLLVDGLPPSGSGVHPAPSGVKATLFNDALVGDTAGIQVLCGALEPGFSANTVAGVVAITSRTTGRAVVQCPQGQVALGGGYSAPALAVRSSNPHFRAPPHYLDERADGTHEAPGGWEVAAYNPGNTTQQLTAYVACYQVPDAVALVGSAALVPGEVRFVGQAASDQLVILGGGASGGSEGYVRAGARWDVGYGFNYSRISWKLAVARAGTPGAAAGGPQPKVAEFRTGGGGILGSFVQDLRPAGSALPATPVKAAMIAVPGDGPVRATTVVEVVEYYNDARDHYFMTAIAQEISDLDSGVHPGWTRTGQSFKAYASASGGVTGRLPFCRHYGLPQAGLDSHFYTGSVLECLDVITKFRGAWQLEGGEVFQAMLPDVRTGACAAGTVAVYRTWNGRADSNHRYMTDLAIRAQMVAAGNVPEGYGPTGVAFCALA